MFRTFRNLLSIIGLILLLIFIALLTTLIILFTWNPMLATDIIKPMWGKVGLWICGIKLDVEGRENLKEKFPAIFIGNHQSLLDVYIFPALLPKKIFVIGKKELLKYPFLGWIFYLTGSIPVDRSNHIQAMKSMEKVYDKINTLGYGVFFCPEGTRSFDGNLLPFKRGAFHLAIQTKLPLVPIIMFGAHKFMKRGSVKINTGTLKVKVLPPIETSHWKGENLNQHIQEVWNIFSQELQKHG